METSDLLEGPNHSILTPRVGWWVKLSMTAHLKAMKRTDEFTGNVRGVLSSHDVTVTAYQNRPSDLL